MVGSLQIIILLPAVVVCMSLEKLEEQDAMTKLKTLRSIMSQKNISAYIVPTDDDHLSEYILEADRRRTYLTDFTGSYGTAVVTEDKAVLWTDSRYYIQAAKQIDPKLWTLMKQGEEGVPKIHEWLIDNLKNGSNVGVDPKKIDASQFEDSAKALAKKGIQLIPVLPNLIDEIWEHKPEYPQDLIYIYSIEFAGESWEDKVEELQRRLNGSSLVVSALDEVAWLTNLRGSDFPYSPLFRSFLILHNDQMTLYLPPEKNIPLLKNHFESTKYHVKIEEYKKFWDGVVELGKISNNITLPTIKRGGTSYHIKSLLPSDKINKHSSPIMEMKSYKNKIEAEGMRKAHIRDAVALCQMMYDLTNDLDSANDSIIWDELKVLNGLEQLRSEQKLNMGSSFAAIVAFGPNSALPHYAVTTETNLRITNEGPLTIDSGGQYLDGTIDTTRVVRAGTPTENEKIVYTALLRGVINLATTVFPEGTKMSQLEFIARRPLYQSGRDFGHGITHGTGSFLSVHENYNGSLRENFVGSQEPGYYKENDFGMRLENLIIVVPAKVENLTKRKLLTFDQLTLVPYERKLINISEMDPSELLWLNDYHLKVKEDVGAEMLKQNRHELYQWLIEQTKPLKKKNQIKNKNEQW